MRKIFSDDESIPSFMASSFSCLYEQWSGSSVMWLMMNLSSLAKLSSKFLDFFCVSPMSFIYADMSRVSASIPSCLILITADIISFLLRPNMSAK